VSEWSLDEEKLRRELVETSKRLHQMGWVANHDGNVTARISDSRLLCTPTAVSKGDVEPEWLIVVDENGAVVEGTRRAFSELRLHRVAYRVRPDIGVVIHAHPPAVTAFAVSGADLGHPFMAEPVVTLGPEIPVVAYHPTGSEELDTVLGEALLRADVVILEQHGALAVGGSLEQAYLRMELLEHLARISAKARPLGGVRGLPEAHVAALSKKGRPRSVPDFSECHQAEAVSKNVSETTATRSSSTARASTDSGLRPNVGALVRDALERLG
jgi:L-fuculose-phosphate aldolase